VIPAEKRIRIVLSIVGGEITSLEAARNVQASRAVEWPVEGGVARGRQDCDDRGQAGSSSRIEFEPWHAQLNRVGDSAQRKAALDHRGITYLRFRA